MTTGQRKKVSFWRNLDLWQLLRSMPVTSDGPFRGPIPSPANNDTSAEPQSEQPYWPFSRAGVEPNWKEDGKIFDTNSIQTAERRRDADKRGLANLTDEERIQASKQLEWMMNKEYQPHDPTQGELGNLAGRCYDWEKEKRTSGAIDEHGQVFTGQMTDDMFRERSNQRNCLDGKREFCTRGLDRIARQEALQRSTKFF